MLNGLAIWHYHHRNLAENIRFFAGKGFESVSSHGDIFYREISNPDVAEALRETGVVFTVHHKLPLSHGEEDLSYFKQSILAMGKWQEQYGLISVLSFDVPQKIRDNITDYISFVLETVPDCKVAIEDFGLTPLEKEQIECFKTNDRFGYLIDVGHMYIRLRGKYKGEVTLFTNSVEEGGACENPGYEEFKSAFLSKEFPIWEIHLHNNNGVDDLHQFLEDGSLNVPVIAKLVKDIEFKGVLTNEGAPGFTFKCYGDDADNGILKSFEYWKGLCDK